MNDTEMLNLIEHYQWAIAPLIGGGWAIECSDGNDDPGEIVLVQTRNNLRDAIRLAVRKQADLGLGK